MRFRISFLWVYNLANLAGVAMIGWGFGLIKLEYGLIAAGGVLLLLNIFNMKASSLAKRK